MQLTGNGFGRSRVPVKLNVKRKKLKLYGGHVKATYRMSFKVPSGITAKYACTGKLGSSVSVSGRKSKNRTRIYALPGKIGRPPHCYSDFRVKLPARALGRKAKFELKFPANEVLVDSRRIVRLRIN